MRLTNRRTLLQNISAASLCATNPFMGSVTWAATFMEVEQAQKLLLPLSLIHI